MDTDKSKNVSRFTLDGVVAEMVIEVEDSQKPGVEDFKELEAALCKSGSASNKDEDVSENKACRAEENFVELLSEKKEDKENVAETSETSHNIIEDKISDKSSYQTWKNKRKPELNMNRNENEGLSDLPRYPGRKRQANKRYISDDLLAPTSDRPESVQFKDSPKEKKRKLDPDLKDIKKEVKMIPKSKPPRKQSQNGKEESSFSFQDENGIEEESACMKKVEHADNMKEKSALVLEHEMETEEHKTKQKLRKLPFRKNTDAPDIPDLKPKVFWWNGVGEGLGMKLGELPEIRKRIRVAKSVRALYRVLFFQWPTNDQEKLVGEILKFNGFPFDKASYEFTKRQSLMKIMLDITISNICEILGVKKGSKSTMINNILNFLLKPYGKVDPTLDPSLQPYVLLERLTLDDKFLEKFLEYKKSKKRSRATKSKVLTIKNEEKSFESQPVTSFRTTRNSLSRMQTGVSSETEKSGKTNEDLKAVTTIGKLKPSSKESDSSAKGKTTPAAKDNKLPTKIEKAKVGEKARLNEGLQKSEDQTNVSRKGKKYKKILKKDRVFNFNLQKGTGKKSLDNEPKSKVNNDVEMEVDNEHFLAGESETKGISHETVTAEEKDKVQDKEQKNSSKVTVSISDSSETESSEETKFVTASLSPPKTPQKSSFRRKGKPLKMFPKISESIKKANFSALQRLHILLFGASDKAENLKGNILAFGGFPFLEGSDEWKQKHFLLSLLAQNNLREYLKLLCIEYSDDDQPTMINKLMQFLAAPSEDIVENKTPETEEPKVVSQELISKTPQAVPKKGKPEAKKNNVKKKEEKKTNGRNRKVLMSEEEARRLGEKWNIQMFEANDNLQEASFAREQRAIARDSKAPSPVKRQPSANTVSPKQSQVKTSKISKSPMTDPHQLNALLQTVYKRRALKAAGAVVSTPDKGEKIKLGDIENIKFLIVTSNLSDLEVLHRLIYMLPASKSRLRKNILDFDGFGFNEDSEKYKKRMDLLYTLGYDVSKRLSFLLGLCPLQTDIPQQDLNELIMYFLMSPCKSKQVVPITQMPADPTIRLPEENLVRMTSPPDADKNSYYQSVLRSVPESISVSEVTLPEENHIQILTPGSSGLNQKAKKSFSSSLKVSPVQKVLLPPAASPVIARQLSCNLKKKIVNIPNSVAVLNSFQGLPTYSAPKTQIHTTGTNISLQNATGNVAILNASKSSNANALIKVPVINTGSKIQLMNQASKVAVLDAATKIPMSTIPNISGQIMQNSVIFPNVSNKINVQPQQNTASTALLPGPRMLVKSPGGIASPQEFLVQQQTPDGQQKTFKLIRLPPNHPLASAVIKPSVQQTVSAPQIQQQVIFTNAPLRGNSPPPGFVMMKSNTNLQIPAQNLQSFLQTLPLKVNMSVNKTSSSVLSTSPPHAEEFVLPDLGESAGTSENDPDIEILNPLEDNPPTDDDLFASIQEIILSSNFEDITLRNVIERVSAQFPHHDLTNRHNYMKDCVKKIIIGTS